MLASTRNKCLPPSDLPETLDQADVPKEEEAAERREVEAELNNGRDIRSENNRE
jgi:hypothetical protein